MTQESAGQENYADAIPSGDSMSPEMRTWVRLGLLITAANCDILAARALCDWLKDGLPGVAAGVQLRADAAG